MPFLRIFIAGAAFLFLTLILNGVAKAVGLMSWYDFIDAKGQAPLVSLLWLFVGYPFCLGLLVYFLRQLI